MPTLTCSKSAVSLSQEHPTFIPSFGPKTPTVLKSIAKADPAIRKTLIEEGFRLRYNLEPRHLQVECVLLLLAGWNTFLLASMGFGKSKVPEMYLNTFPKNDKAIVLVLNPLDALGDNQVAEKIHDGYTALSLTQRTFNKQVYDEILAGEYQFIYLSPEIFLNSPLFTNLYFNPIFQSRLVLKVVDEAHLIYCWGLVADGSMRTLSCFKNLQDRGVFRPSYGNLYARFLATDHAKILLMSATCRPKALEAIKKNLRLGIHNLKVRTAELVRPEVRLIRMTMKHPIKDAEDLRLFFGPEDLISNCNLPPTLIYSGTRDGTYKTMSAVNNARGRPGLTNDGLSPLARRFHAGTGPDDKTDRAVDFIGSLFSVMCCTMALGLGQNWKLVRRVIVVGRTEPSAVAQMVGRCGRDGRPGVSILLSEEQRGGAGAKNHPSEFGDVSSMSDDNRMDALAVTPVCLRVALAVDNSVGHIPISFEDEHYIKEKTRQQDKRFAPCLCSNCEPQAALDFFNRQHQATNDNFTDIIMGTMVGTFNHDLCCPPSETLDSKLPVILTCPPSDRARKMPVMKALVAQLMSAFDKLYDEDNPEHDCLIDRRDMFNLEDHAWPIAKNADVISQTLSLRAILGSEAIDGIFDCILECISRWQQSDIYKQNQHDIYSIAQLRVKKLEKKAPKRSGHEAGLDKTTPTTPRLPKSHINPANLVRSMGPSPFSTLPAPSKYRYPAVTAIPILPSQTQTPSSCTHFNTMSPPSCPSTPYQPAFSGSPTKFTPHNAQFPCRCFPSTSQLTPSSAQTPYFLSSGVYTDTSKGSYSMASTTPVDPTFSTSSLPTSRVQTGTSTFQHEGLPYDSCQSSATVSHDQPLTPDLATWTPTPQNRKFRNTMFQPTSAPHSHLPPLEFIKPNGQLLHSMYYNTCSSAPSQAINVDHQGCPTSQDQSTASSQDQSTASSISVPTLATRYIPGQFPSPSELHWERFRAYQDR
ncbi:P-loop containing nucleoside triphosphate hydrolase protein [Melampsora americana]|nr:P-loop containing nucleoside triphosphate hydrolase protein [Melampsora americana]